MAALSFFPNLARYASVSFAGQLIPAGTVRAAAIHLMPHAAALGLSASAIRRELRAVFGQAYRWQDLTSDYRRVQNFIRHESQIRNLPQQRDIPRAYYSDERLRGNFPYRVHFEVTYRSRDGLTELTKRASTYSESERGRAGWEEQYREEWRKRVEAYDYEITRIATIAVEHNTGWDY